MMSSAPTLIVLAQAYLTGLALSSGSSVGNFDRPLLRNGTCRLPGYTYTPYIGGHKIHTVVAGWRQARWICRREGGDLAVINSQAEADVIAEIFYKSDTNAKAYKNHSAWIGTRKSAPKQGDDWQTIYGDTVEQAGFAKWHEPKSEQKKKTPDCGSVFRDGNLNWFGCNQLLPFVCEVPYIKPLPSIWNRQLSRAISQELAVRGEADSD